MLYAERAVAVVLDDSLDGVGRGIVGDTTDVAPDLAQRVGVLAGLVVSDFVHDNRAVSGVLAGGDDLVALDELEGELAGGKRAPGQELGRLDLVGDAGLSGGQIVGILELGSLGILQDMLGLERAVALIGDGGHDGVSLAVVGDALAGGSAVDFAQCVGMRSGLVILDGAHRDVTAGVVGAGGDDLVALDKLEGELAGGKLAPGQGLGRGDLVGDAGALGRHGVGVLELNLLDVLGALQLMRGHKLALAIVDDGRHDGIDGFVIGDAAGVALDLTQRIGVLADLGVLDGAERHLAVGSVRNGLDKLRVLTLDLAQLEAELASRKVAPGQGLGHVNLVGDTGLNRLRSVNVLELGLVGFAPGHLHVSAEHALLVGRDRHGDLRDVLAVGNAVNRGPGVLFADLVDIRARLVVFDRAEADGRLVVRVRLGHRRSHGRRRGLGHRGAVHGRQPKLKRVLIRPLAAHEHLGQTKLDLGIHRCRRHVVLIANLAVVAQVGVDMRRGRLGRRVVPLGVEHVGRGTGVVAAHAILGGMELIDKGQACGSHGKHQVTVLIGNNRAVELRGVATDKLDDGGGGLGLAVLALLLKLVLVVIGNLASQRGPLCRLRASLIRVNGRLLLEIVIAVGVGRFKGRNRIAQRAGSPLVRVEIHGLGAVNDGRIMLDVVLEPRDLLGRKQVVERNALHTRGVLHADRLSAVDRKLAVFVLKVALRNQRRRNLDRYDIAGLRLALFGMLNGDDQVRGITRECVGVDVVLGLCRLVKRRAVVYKTVDLHKVAQLIGKRNVAGLGRVVTLVDFGRVRCFRRNGL